MSLNDKASCGLMARLLGEVNRAKGETASANEQWAAAERAGRSHTAKLTQQLTQARTTASTEHALRQVSQASRDVAQARCAELGKQLAQAQQAADVDRALRDRVFTQQQATDASAAASLRAAACEHEQQQTPADECGFGVGGSWPDQAPLLLSTAIHARHRTSLR